MGVQTCKIWFGADHKIFFSDGLQNLACICDNKLPLLHKKNEVGTAKQILSILFLHERFIKQDKQ